MKDRIQQQAERIRDLLDENAALRDRLEQMEDALLGDVDRDVIAGLTHTEAMIVGLLVRRDICTKEQLHQYLYAERPDAAADIKIIDVMICKIRPKLKPLGVEIETIWGHGYRIAKGREQLSVRKPGVAA